MPSLVNDKQQKKVVASQLVAQFEVGFLRAKRNLNGTGSVLKKTVDLFGSVAFDLRIDKQRSNLRVILKPSDNGRCLMPSDRSRQAVDLLRPFDANGIPRRFRVNRFERWKFGQPGAAQCSPEINDRKVPQKFGRGDRRSAHCGKRQTG
jgi:hypothetical protein